MKDRLLEISAKEKLSHIGSCLTVLPIIEEIYRLKKPEDKFVLSSGHAHLAHALVMGREDMPAGIHCDRQNGCDVSTGSLGLGITIALGLALADKRRGVWCIVSDGECGEGVVWEALRIKTELGLSNLKVYANINGYTAYGVVDKLNLAARLKTFDPSINIRFTKIDDDILEQYPQLQGLGGHYKTI